MFYCLKTTKINKVLLNIIYNIKRKKVSEYGSLIIVIRYHTDDATIHKISFIVLYYDVALL